MPTSAQQLYGFSQKLHWPHGAEEWQAMKDIGQLYSLSDNDAPYATALLVQNNPAWYNIGMVLVDPDHQRRGIGRFMMRHAMNQITSPTATLSLTASPAGEQLYKTIDFKQVGLTHIFQGQAGHFKNLTAANSGHIIKSFTRGADEGPQDSLITFDAEQYGFSRQTMLERWLGFCDKIVTAHDPKTGHTQGYAGLFRRRANNEEHFVVGPLVAQSSIIAYDLITALARHPKDDQKLCIFAVNYDNAQTDQHYKTERAALFKRLSSTAMAEKIPLPIMTHRGMPLPAYQRASIVSPISLAIG